MASDAGAGPDVTAFERIGAPSVPYPPYNQLDTQIAGLRAQLLVAEEQLQRTEGMLRRADENLARQHPDKVSPRLHEVEPEHLRSRSSASPRAHRSGGSKSKRTTISAPTVDK
jgi:hypothetical protein